MGHRTKRGLSADRAAIERIVRPIVEGQIRGFINEHPEILRGVDWYKPRSDKAATLLGSLAKRIIPDLASEGTARRLRAALLQSNLGAPSPPADGTTAVAGAPDLGCCTGSGAAARDGSC